MLETIGFKMRPFGLMLSELPRCYGAVAGE